MLVGESGKVNVFFFVEVGLEYVSKGRNEGSEFRIFQFEVGVRLLACDVANNVPGIFIPQHNLITPESLCFDDFLFNFITQMIIQRPVP